MADHKGFITRDDLKAYQAKLRPAVHTTFRGYDVFGMGPPSSGGIVLCQMLNILERFDLKRDGRDSPRTLHRVTEAMRRAYFTRATRLADPDFVAVPWAGAHIEGPRRRACPLDQRQGHAQPATSPRFRSRLPRRDHTTHLSTIDQAGNAVALTYTLEDSYGAKCVVAGAGFLLNNEMGDFNLIPGRTEYAGTDRHAGEPDRAGQADAQLPDTDAGARRTAGCGW